MSRNFAGSSKAGNTSLLVGAVAATAALSAYLVYLRSKRGSASDSDSATASKSDKSKGNSNEDGDLTLEHTIWVLRRIAVNFHNACRELGEIAHSVNANLEMQGMDLPPEKLQAQLLEQSKILEKLDTLQTYVLEHERVAPETLQRCQTVLYSDVSEVAALTDGLQAMLQAALSGQVPILPWIASQNLESMGEDKGEALMDAVLATLREIQETETELVIRYFRDEAGVGLQSLEGLSEILSRAVVTAEKAVLGERLDDATVAARTGASAEKVFTCEEFFSYVGFFKKHSETFAAEEKRMVREHRARMSRLFTPQEVKIEPSKI